MSITMHTIRYHNQPTVLGKNAAMKILLDTNATKTHNRFTRWNTQRGGVQIDLAAFSFVAFIAILGIAWVVKAVS